MAGALALALGVGPAHAQECDAARVMLRGHVADAATGVALPGATVQVVWREEDGRERADSTVAGPRGEFAVCGPPPQVEARLWGEIAGIRGEAVSTVGASDGPLTLQVTLGAEEGPSRVRRLEEPGRAAEGGAAWGTVVGEVRERGTGRPLPDAYVELGEAVAGLTDREGRISVRRVKPGTHEIRARVIGFRPLRDSIVVRAGGVTRLEIELAPEGVPVDPIVVSVVRDARLERHGFYERAHWGELLGAGEFLGPEEMEELRSRPRISDVLDAISLVDMLRVCRATCYKIPRVTGAPPRLSPSGPVPCPADVYLDGTRVRLWRWNPDNTLEVIAGVDEFVIPAAVGAIEVYRRASELPGEFGGASDGCGAVVIWTR